MAVLLRAFPDEREKSDSSLYFFRPRFIGKLSRFFECLEKRTFWFFIKNVSSAVEIHDSSF